jgi:hypothetical protein
MTLDKVPWARRMRRLHPGDPAEWMAPGDVVNQVRAAYLRGLEWLGESQFWPRGQQLQVASHYLAGEALKQYQAALLSAPKARFVGVLRADHEIEVRHFSEGGEHCLLLDCQTGRRMATYNVVTRDRVMTQDMGSGALVYRMAYDVRDRQWKVERFIQELPTGWERRQPNRFIQELIRLPVSGGRDN